MTDKLALLAGIASDWWWEMDTDLRFTFMSDRFVEVFGLPASTLIGKLRTDVDGTDYGNPAWIAHLDDLTNRRPFRDFETTVVDAAGIPRPVMISGAPMFAPDGAFSGYVGIGRDLSELRRRDEEVARQTANLKAILENIEQGVVLFDNDLRIAAYNSRLSELLQVDDGREATGVPYAKIVRELADRGEYSPEEKEAAIAIRMKLIQSTERTVVERRREDGRIVSAAFSPLPGGGGVIAYTDVTEARERESRLAKSEENFRYLFRSSPLPMWVYSTTSLAFLEVNEAATASYGYTREEFLGMTLTEISPPEDVERLTQWLAHPAGDGLFAGEFRHRRKAGQIMDVEVFASDIDYEGQPACLALINDVTARKLVERECERIFETSQDVIIVANGYGGIVQVSPSVLKALGYRPDEMIGRSGEEFLLLADLESTRNEMRVVRAGTAARDFKCRYVHKNGQIVSLSWMAVWSEPDRRYYFAGRDTTEHDRTEKQLRQAQKMEAVGQLTGGVAHDFNNILMVILANVDALEEEGGLASPLRDRLKGISDATQRAADLTRQLLAFSRKQALQPRRTDLNALVTATCSLLRSSLGEQVEIELALGKALWSADIDRAQLESALVNLSINARDAMPGGGRLLIETANATLGEDDVAARTDAVAGDYVMLAVTDTGHGMSPDILKKVFEPFFTTKEVGKGSGLGLSMVYGFVKQSNGHIVLSSEVGRGTSIRLYLPRHTGDAKEKLITPRPKIQGGSERVLVVEDEPQVREVVAGQLRSLGYDVAEAADGEAGLAALEAASLPYDVLLTDVIMPGALNGQALAEEASRRWPTTRAVFMSGYTEDAIARENRLEADVLLLNKPFRKIELARILRQALDRAIPKG